MKIVAPPPAKLNQKLPVPVNHPMHVEPKMRDWVNNRKELDERNAKKPAKNSDDGKSNRPSRQGKGKQQNDRLLLALHKYFVTEEGEAIFSADDVAEVNQMIRLVEREMAYTNNTLYSHFKYEYLPTMEKLLAFHAKYGINPEFVERGIGEIFLKNETAEIPPASTISPFDQLYAEFTEVASTAEGDDQWREQLTAAGHEAFEILEQTLNSLRKGQKAFLVQKAKDTVSQLTQMMGNQPFTYDWIETYLTEDDFIRVANSPSRKLMAEELVKTCSQLAQNLVSQIAAKF